jgi:uncharacterized repeat protein (TIGR01451 family)
MSLCRSYRLALAVLLAVAATSALGLESPQTEAEQALARAAEEGPARVATRGIAGVAPSSVVATGLSDGPLFVGVDDSTVPAYQIDVTTSAAVQAFVGFQVWGAAYDAANQKVYFNSGSTLYEWPVGGAVATLGTIVDPGGATQSMVGLAFHAGTLYGVKNIANEAVYIIDTTTLVATVHIDYEDADYDFGGLAADPVTGTLYATNDDTTPFGSGLYRINLDGTATLIAPYPAGQTDIDGLAISRDGRAYLVTDEPGFIYVWDFAAGAYAEPLTSPWTTSEVFSAGAWIEVASISLVKTVGTDPGVCAPTSQIAVPAGTTVYYCYTATNTGGVPLSNHDIVDSELGAIVSLQLVLAPGDSAFVSAVPTVINATTTNTATWTAYTPGVATASAEASATVEVLVQDADLVLAKTVSPAIVPPLGTVTWTLTVTNNGPGAAPNTVVTDTLPAGFNWVSDTCAAGPPAGGTLTWNVGFLANGASASCDVVGQVWASPGEPVVNNVTATSDMPDPTSATASATVIVDGSLTAIPAISPTGLAALAVLLAGAALFALRRTPLA